MGDSKFSKPNSNWSDERWPNFLLVRCRDQSSFYCYLQLTIQFCLFQLNFQVIHENREESEPPSPKPNLKYWKSSSLRQSIQTFLWGKKLQWKSIYPSQECRWLNLVVQREFSGLFRFVGGYGTLKQATVLWRRLMWCKYRLGKKNMLQL